MSEVVIDAEAVKVLDATDGDMLLVTLPQEVLAEDVGVVGQGVNDQFEAILDGKDVKIVVIPFGMKVELVTTSTLNDKE